MDRISFIPYLPLEPRAIRFNNTIIEKMRFSQNFIRTPNRFDGRIDPFVLSVSPSASLSHDLISTLCSWLYVIVIYASIPIILIFVVFVVGTLGFEPRQTEPKPVVLPLHHIPIISELLITLYSDLAGT